MLGPGKEVLYLVLLPFDHDLDAQVVAVFDPAREPEPFGLALGGGPVVDALDPAADDEM
jgi:hypothetical protein